jgi:2-polyprenyl-3-methyl-5-hydroxy-6-metoxy-1,4-benzoquinol methylase
MSHLNAIRDDSAYAEILENWDANFYAKFTDVLRQAPAGSSILDVGCGVGQVVGQLMVAGYEVHGVDVADPNIQKAQKISPRCQLYDGKRLPYPDRNFSAVGALNVLEHVEDPEEFLAELVRVTEVGGRIVVSARIFFVAWVSAITTRECAASATNGVTRAGSFKSAIR